MYDTKFCVNHPRKKAVAWSGHVHKGKMWIGSGLCEDCSGVAFSVSHHKEKKKICKKQSTSYSGCDGRWRKSYGLIKH
jgi:hypothetical protein